MKNVFGLVLAISACLTFVGCGGSGENTNVVESAGKSAIEEYEAAIAADAAAMDADMKSEAQSAGKTKAAE